MQLFFVNLLHIGYLRFLTADSIGLFEIWGILIHQF